jgi:thioredoxin reductase/NAD-dependent dihydropyrimidine dehydrogenase PreA subunit
MIETMPTSGYQTYVLALVALWCVIGVYRWFRERYASSRHQRAIDAGATEPPSLHPVIDPSRCVGCGACTHACPEGRIIGMIGDKAQLLDPASCIGHGACKTACPVGAIDLVFGTARRGVDIPVISPHFESNVPGLFIAGELGGMGLIANAIEQGRQAIDTIAKHDKLGQRDLYDVVIVGGGPAGISASLAAKEKNLRYLTVEQDSLGGTVARYPRGKIVMTRPAQLPLYGKVKLRRVRKEKLLALWKKVVGDTGIEIHNGVRVDRITPHDWGFELATTAGLTRTSTVLLATGRRGSPRRLGVPGETLSKVVYSLDDPAQYRGQHVLVVGGGDSAAEAVLALTRHRVASVTLSYRGATLARAKSATRSRLDEAVLAGKIQFLPSSHVRAIEADRVIIDQPGQRHTPRNDAVIICAGGTLPTALLNDIGVQVETKYGAA